jgi:hypothetical protein
MRTFKKSNTPWKVTYCKWHGKDAKGKFVPAGLYIAHIKAGKKKLS